MSVDRRRISIALCTYNGAAYLSEQLQSLSRQTRLPDELIVCDDGSTDDTIKILRSFAAECGFAVEIVQNPTQLGPAANFNQAIGRCTGDIIAFCDQDDVWMPGKLALIEAAFEKHPDLGFVFSDADICDEACRPLGYRLWDSVRLGRHLRGRLEKGDAFPVILRQNVVTGATMALAARLRPLVLPVDGRWMHDGWIAILLAAVAPVAMIAEPMMLYRQHSTQAVGALQRTLYQQYKAARKMDRDVFEHQAAMYDAVLQRLTSNHLATPAPGTLELLSEKIRHCRTRSAIRRRECSRVLPSIRELLTLRYRHFSLGWKSFAQDLFL